MKKKNVLLVGSGGREHTIAWKMKQSKTVEQIFCLPGNAGISEIAECVDISVNDIDGICEFAKNNDIDLAVIGPEDPLAKGIVDELEKSGIRTFGPNKKCARLEASKSFTKEFLLRHNIPTARYKEYENAEELKKDVGIFGYPMVLKADGLAAGKGVIIAEDRDSALKGIDELMVEDKFGEAGNRVVVEEFLTGIEASMLCFVDENTIVPMESAQDYKRIFDGDKGENTGGMGTYSPSRLFDKNLTNKIRMEILEPTLEGFKKDGLDFKGVLFIGLMIKGDDVRVIEFNNRFGDPETQVVLRRLDTDIVEIFEAVVDNKLAGIDIKWTEEHVACVVLASGGYPKLYEKGKVIKGLKDVEDDVIVFHAGTKFNEKGETVTSGGRVLGVIATGNTHEEAVKKVYANVEKITFEGMQYRKDIGK